MLHFLYILLRGAISLEFEQNSLNFRIRVVPLCSTKCLFLGCLSVRADSVARLKTQYRVIVIFHEDSIHGRILRSDSFLKKKKSNASIKCVDTCNNFADDGKLQGNVSLSRLVVILVTW